MKDNTTCSEVMDKFLELDKDQRIPLWITNHLLGCSECRKKVKMFNQAEKYLTKEGTIQDPFTFSTISDVKEKIYPGSTKEKKVPLRHWLIAGIILMLCMILASVSVSKYFPEFQNISFIFVAGAVTTYCMLFIGMNMDLLRHES